MGYQCWHPVSLKNVCGCWFWLKDHFKFFIQSFPMCNYFNDPHHYAARAYLKASSLEKCIFFNQVPSVGLFFIYFFFNQVPSLGLFLDRFQWCLLGKWHFLNTTNFVKKLIQVIRVYFLGLKWILGLLEWFLTPITIPLSTLNPRNRPWNEFSATLLVKLLAGDWLNFTVKVMVAWYDQVIIEMFV